MRSLRSPHERNTDRPSGGRVMPRFQLRVERAKGRHLHRRGGARPRRPRGTDEGPGLEGEPPAVVPVPARTVQRWHSRLTQAALAATQALATSGDPALRAVAQRVGLVASRQALVETYTENRTRGAAEQRVAPALGRVGCRKRGRGFSRGSLRRAHRRQEHRHGCPLPDLRRKLAMRGLATGFTGPGCDKKSHTRTRPDIGWDVRV